MAFVWDALKPKGTTPCRTKSIIYNLYNLWTEVGVGDGYIPGRADLRPICSTYHQSDTPNTGYHFYRWERD